MIERLLIHGIPSLEKNEEGRKKVKRNCPKKRKLLLERSDI
jgi:hypothetical protein